MNKVRREPAPPGKRWRGIGAALSELGCGFLTVLFITVPVWVMTVAWRGPLFGLGMLVVLIALLFIVALINRRFDL